MPKMNPYRITGPETSISFTWAAGVFESSASIYIVRNGPGRITNTRIEATLPTAVGLKMQELLGGTYSGKKWRVPGPEQLKVCSTMMKYVLDNQSAARLSAVMAYRRTLGKPGITTTPDVLEYRERAAQRILDANADIPYEDTFPPALDNPTNET